MKKNSWKIIAGVLVLSLASGSGLAVYKNENPSAGSIFRSFLGKEKLSDQELKEIRKLKNDVDVSYIENICTYFDESSDLNNITDEDLKNIYGQALNYYCTLKQYKEYNIERYGDYGDFDIDPYFGRIVIEDDQLVEHTGEIGSVQEWSFKGSVFNKFNQITGIDVNSRNINMDSDDIEYDGENCNVEFTDNLESSVECQEISTLIVNPGEMIVNLKKKETDTNGKSHKTKEHAVIVPADNDYGYKIKAIKKGYVEKAQLVEGMIVEDESKIISESLENDDSSKKVDKATRKQYNKDSSYTSITLRSEGDVEKNETSFYYLLVGEDDVKEDKYLKRTITLVPADNIYGYKVKKIKTEKWEDEYSKEIEEIAAKEVGLRENQSLNDLSKYREIEQKIIDLWMDETDSVIERISEKYPSNKEKIETNQEEYWNQEIADLKERFQITSPDALEGEVEIGNATVLINETAHAKRRCYYLIGNALMEDHLEEILEKDF